ncbi:RNAse III [Sulfuritortus calidifontis]|uniref:Ribonuclease 3 n=1 Tax=Sulfuritortus calidifontis TaxID=1914471 RepID=A0A4V2UQG2_9PROT|nr:ribonuclease III [Sulfuritortus calidifontis]TCS70439.1 RNAse III [Sulfuritortus calidifontis]
MTADLASLEARIGHRFGQRELLEQALTHRSYAARNNERLEFLGDSVLNCVVGLMLYRRFQQLQEGQLSRLRANLVNQQSLCEVARRIGLGAYLKLGEGELRSGGADRPSILADALESLFGAAFLDAGFPAAEGVIERLMGPAVVAIDPHTQGKDAKTLLQEWLQARRKGLPDYQLVAVTGQAHAQVFTVECRIEALGLRCQGTGNSRKAAEQAAAGAAYAQLAGH